MNKRGLRMGLILWSFTWIPAGAADLIEPWPVGLSSFELAVAAPSGGERSASSVLGFGLDENLSLGFVFAAAENERTGMDLFLLYTHSIGERTALDGWCEIHVDRTDGPSEPACGVEWSLATGLLVPYARLLVARTDEGTAAVPMLGAMVPLSSALQLHFELSSEAETDGGRPLRFALGPNWAFGTRLELVPEVSWSDRSDGGRALELGLGLVIDLSRW